MFNDIEIKAIAKLYDYLNMDINSAEDDYNNYYLTIHEEEDGEIINYYDGNREGSVKISIQMTHTWHI